MSSGVSLSSGWHAQGLGTRGQGAMQNGALVGMEPGLVGWQQLLQVMVRPKEPGLMQRPLTWGGRGCFESKAYNRRLLGCSFCALVSLWSLFESHSCLMSPVKAAHLRMLVQQLQLQGGARPPGGALSFIRPRFLLPSPGERPQIDHFNFPLLFPVPYFKNFLITINKQTKNNNWQCYVIVSLF